MKLLSVMFVIACMFPYTQVVPSESYSQPYALVLGGLLFVLYGKRVLAMLPKGDTIALLGLAVVGMAAFVITCWPVPDAQELKYLLIYLSPLVLVVASLAALCTYPAACVATVAWSAVVWLLVGVVQTVYDPTFGTSLVGTWQDAAEVVVASGRGVLGLAPEPTHYGFHLLVLGGILAALGRRLSVAWLCVLGAIVLAKSSSAMLALGLAGVVLVVQQPIRFRWVIGATALVVPIGLILLAGVDSEETRILKLLVALLADPKTFLLVDYSVNVRIGGWAASFWYSLQSFLMPHGLSSESWLEASRDIVNRFDWLFEISTSGPPSGFGIVIYQTGVFGLVFLLRPVARILLTPIHDLSKVIVLACGFVFLSQFMISAPGYSLLYAALIYRALQQRDSAKESPAEPSHVDARTDANPALA